MKDLCGTVHFSDLGWNICSPSYKYTSLQLVIGVASLLSQKTVNTRSLSNLLVANWYMSYALREYE